MATPNRFFKWFSNYKHQKASLAHRVGTHVFNAGPHRELATLGPPPITKVVEQFSLEDQRQGEQPQEEKPAKTPDGRKKTKKQAATTEPYAPVPYPQRLRQNKLDKQFTKFMEVFKKLHINIPFADALEQMPS